jgi:hypothetical protein
MRILLPSPLYVRMVPLCQSYSMHASAARARALIGREQSCDGGGLMVIMVVMVVMVDSFLPIYGRVL